MHNHPDIAIRHLSSRDLTLACQITRDAYRQNFAHHWQEGGLEEYVEAVFGTAVLAEALTDPSLQYHVAFAGGIPVAFMKLRLFSNLPDLDPEKGIELDKLYILPGYQGLKLGHQMLDLALGIAREMQKQVFWLAVIDTNTKAIAFYEKAGFRRHSPMRVGYPKFREELKGMWRMWLEM
jgi:ribosomal protein S18 acetylase RimI-like enzyme